MDDIVFLFDVDNTLLDNDAIQVDLRAHLIDNFGEAAEQRYWALFEELRGELAESGQHVIRGEHDLYETGASVQFVVFLDSQFGRRRVADDLIRRGF